MLNHDQSMELAHLVFNAANNMADKGPTHILG